jgi:uncharacterized protein (TIGR03437 family)
MLSRHRKCVGPGATCAVALVAIACATTTRANPAPNFTGILGGSGQDFATSVAADAQGNTYVAGQTYSSDFHVTPGAFQTTFGGTRDAFVAKFNADGTLAWSTYLGGILDDWATGVGVDASGNVVVTGWSRSANFPILNSLQPLSGGMIINHEPTDAYDGFVAKLTPDGKQLVFSTFIGGEGDDGVNGLALDSAGNAYLTGPSTAGFTGASSGTNTVGMFVAKLSPTGKVVYVFIRPSGYPNGVAVDSAGSAYVTGQLFQASSLTKTFGPVGIDQAMVFKLSSDGSHEIYETGLGGSVKTEGMAVAVDSAGSAYVGGVTTSIDFPLVHPLQSSLGARPLWVSGDQGATFAPIDGLPFAYLQALVADPTTPGKLFAASAEAGLFRSLDGGNTWQPASNGITGLDVAAASDGRAALAIDPQHSSTLFAALGMNGKGVIYRTTDGGNAWAAVDQSTTGVVQQLAVDARNTSSVYAVWNNVTRKSTDGGLTWNTVVFPGAGIAALALDPRLSGTIFVISTEILIPHQGGTLPYVWRSTDGGSTWTQLTSVMPFGYSILIDGSTNPSTIYQGVKWRSNDGGNTWTQLPQSAVDANSNPVVTVDAAGRLYASVYGGGIFTSADQGNTWTQIGSPVPKPQLLSSFVPNIMSILPANGQLYLIVQNKQTSAFVSKVTPDGSSLVFSTLLNGHASLETPLIFNGEPDIFRDQTWISAMALDPSGNVVVAGGTRASDFPTANASRNYNSGQADAFIATIAADGSKLVASTYFGGSRDDAALGVAVDAQGDVIAAGQTWSADFPVPGGIQPPAGFSEAFVARLAPVTPPVITGVVNGASLQPGIAVGSWVTVFGQNLANTVPGRIWTSAELAGGAAPTSMDGVTVSIDGKTAPLAYISPGQINLLAPADSATGTVSVVVHNNGVDGAAAMAQLQAAAPAFFEYPGTNFAVASRLPDYAPIGDPSAIPGAVPARPGDRVVLWGTGFGATQPPVSPGSIVKGVPAVVNLPLMTVGGIQASVLNVVLTAGFTGLYQATIQVPTSAAAGTTPVQASVGGAQSPANVAIFVAN